MKPCPKTIDKPLLILGLEGEDVAVLMLVFGVPAILISPAALVLIFAAWPALVYFKRGKPQGYVLHTFYRLSLPLPGLLPPQVPGQRFGVKGKHGA
ncbi:MAG: type IV conjugative transfer system protein TraL [Candidatus Omnitrophota bacterium]